MNQARLSHVVCSSAEESSMSPRIVIVGGVAGGMSAATRARRTNEHAQITVLERTGHISFANCGLPYFIGGKIKDESSLYLTTPERVKSRFRIDARVHHEVTRIDRARRVVEGTNLANGERFSLEYDKLILAPGAYPIIPKLDGIDSKNVFVLRNIEDTLALKSYLTERSPKRAVVVGAGFIGLEMVEALHDLGLQVTVVEKAPYALPALDREMSGWIEAELARNSVVAHLSTGLSSLEVAGNLVRAIVTDRGERIETDLVLLSMGVRPSTQLAELAGIALGPTGGILVDDFLRTSDPNVYAVGDAAQVTQGVTGIAARIPLAGAANRHGRAAGQHAATGHGPPGAAVFATAIVRIFGLDVGITGLGPLAARSAGFDADTAIVNPNDHAAYYPGASQMHLMLVYDRVTGKVLGAQAIGAAGVDKRIDVIATAMHFGGTLDDLAALDLSYAPQFSGAKDPVHFAAFVADNQRRGLTPATDSPSDGALLLDVRTRAEAAKGMLPGAVNLPLDELRGRLSELETDRPIVVYCQVGVRGHAAVRILLANGFADVKNLKGGYAQAAVRLGR
jgi:NADPH-dependent 2,4-dienoyl-CoA reductase/sulfur reductase-like enzyme/rhodanese-related sulfurtransferase